jgi:hypothetical protein
MFSNNSTLKNVKVNVCPVVPDGKRPVQKPGPVILDLQPARVGGKAETR